MIHFTFFFLSASLFAVTLFLMIRLRQANRAVASLFQRKDIVDRLAQQLVHVISRGIDACLLGEAGQGGLADIEIPFREFQDPYRSLDGLLTHLSKSLTAKKFGDVIQLIKILYQLQSSLSLSPAELASCLTLLESRLKNDSDVGNNIARIDIVQPGTILDPKKMISLNSGTHVKHPLGVVILDFEGKVISKAKVICG